MTLKPRDLEVTESDSRAFLRLISTELTVEQRERVARPGRVEDRQKDVLAVHWHPEFVPLDLIVQRVRATFPHREVDLVIPTQHNMLTSLNGFAGVEIDCFARSFGRKVQLLAHFEESKLARADVLRGMLAKTFDIRARQLFEYLDTIIEPVYEARFGEAAKVIDADEEMIQFVRAHARKLRHLLAIHERQTPKEAIKNKLVTLYFDGLRGSLLDGFLDRVQRFLKAVKGIVKAHFSSEHFYETTQVIEEVRGLGGGLVIPHPEAFWPILLADYDVDGIEVWNPRSRQYTEFLIEVVHRHNRSGPRTGRPLLVFMGDDTHMGEKVYDPRGQDEEKAGREIGVQPAWDDPAIRKALEAAGTDRRQVIDEYKQRLGA